MLRIGDPAPDFALPNQDGKLVRLSDLRGKKVVLFAFPKANEMSAGCIAQACEFRDEFPRFESSQAVVLGISADKPDDLKKWRAKRKLPYDLLADADHAMLTAYGAWGYDLGLIKMPMIKRSYWVIDEAGIVIDMQIGVAPKTSVEKAIQALGQAQPVTV